MKIGLYFGSFNPVHTGHLIIANHVRQQAQLDQVWLIVSPQNPLKPSAGLLNEFHRLALVQLGIDDEPGLKASDIEFRLSRPSYTVDTLAYLQEKYPQHQFSVIMGSDSFQNLAKWKNPEYILKHHVIYVYKRPGFEIKNDLTENVQVLDAPLLEISATHIRNSIKQGKSIRFLVPDKVWEEIDKNGYYK
ncbi:MAG: nicotinate (nicotinamide) nucleotide adenylyltransferase [Chitinophagaceae bacterium]